MTRKRTAQKAAIILALAATPQSGQADSDHKNPAAPEGHAPIMVMGDHMHKAGEFMVSAAAYEHAHGGQSERHK